MRTSIWTSTVSVRGQTPRHGRPHPQPQRKPLRGRPAAGRPDWHRPPATPCVTPTRRLHGPPQRRRGRSGYHAGDAYARASVMFFQLIKADRVRRARMPTVLTSNKLALRRSGPPAGARRRDVSASLRRFIRFAVRGQPPLPTSCSLGQHRREAETRLKHLLDACAASESSTDPRSACGRSTVSRHVTATLQPGLFRVIATGPSGAPATSWTCTGPSPGRSASRAPTPSDTASTLHPKPRSRQPRPREPSCMKVRSFR